MNSIDRLRKYNLLVRLFKDFVHKQQTIEELNKGETLEKNHRGFNAYDAKRWNAFIQKMRNAPPAGIEIDDWIIPVSWFNAEAFAILENWPCTYSNQIVADLYDNLVKYVKHIIIVPYANLIDENATTRRSSRLADRPRKNYNVEAALLSYDNDNDGDDTASVDSVLPKEDEKVFGGDKFIKGDDEPESIPGDDDDELILDMKDTDDDEEDSTVISNVINAFIDPENGKEMVTFTCVRPLKQVKHDPKVVDFVNNLWRKIAKKPSSKRKSRRH